MLISYLLFSQVLKPFRVSPRCKYFLEVNINQRSKDFIHPLLVGDIRIAFTPDKKYNTKKLDDRLLLEKLYFLISPLYIFSYFIF